MTLLRRFMPVLVVCLGLAGCTRSALPGARLPGLATMPPNLGTAERTLPASTLPATPSASPPTPGIPLLPSATPSLAPTLSLTQKAVLADGKVETVGHYENILIVVLRFPLKVEGAFQAVVEGSALQCTRQEDLPDRLYCSGLPPAGLKNRAHLVLRLQGQDEPLYETDLRIDPLPTPDPTRKP